MRFGFNGVSDFSSSAFHFELIFGLLIIPKCDLVEVEKTMFQGLACHFQLIFGLWTSQKCDWVEVKTATIFSGCKALLTHFLHP